jgi:glucose/arabinose dehydrogenase
LWVVDGLPDSGGMLEAIVLGGRIASRYRLPEGARPSAIAAYQGDRIPELRGDVLVATPGDRSVLRLTLDANDPTRVVATERWRDDSFDGARALGVGPDGTIYVCGANSLVRLTPF